MSTIEERLAALEAKVAQMEEELAGMPAYVNTVRYERSINRPKEGYKCSSCNGEGYIEVTPEEAAEAFVTSYTQAYGKDGKTLHRCAPCNGSGRSIFRS